MSLVKYKIQRRIYQTISSIRDTLTEFWQTLTHRKPFSFTTASIEHDVPLWLLNSMVLTQVITDPQDYVNQIVKEEKLLPTISKLFIRVKQRIDFLGEKPEDALRILTQEKDIKTEMFKGIILRFARAIEIGSQLDEFFQEEFEIYETYIQPFYQMQMEKSGTIIDGVTAFSVAAVFILVSSTLIIMLQGASTIGVFMLLLTCFFVVMFANTLGAESMEQIPKQPVLNPTVESMNMGSKYGLIFLFAIISIIYFLSDIIASIANGSIMRVVFNLSVKGIPFVIIGIYGLYIGARGRVYQDKVLQNEQYFRTLIKILADESTIEMAPIEVVFNNHFNRKKQELIEEFGSEFGTHLSEAVAKYHLGIDFDDVWFQFAKNTGSYLIYKYSEFFLSLLNTASNPNNAYRATADGMVLENILRSKRFWLVNTLRLKLSITTLMISIVIAFIQASFFSLNYYLGGLFEETTSTGVAGAPLIIVVDLSDLVAYLEYFGFLILFLSLFFVWRFEMIVHQGDSRYQYLVFGITCIGVGLILIIAPILVKSFLLLVID
ncbi:MAG: hypothetical protein INQ03_15795 [Candidatus Heimdallarchaeota archaeon]|nr:hypothetical protein [Candidatus Heimdallarchaeota archaeon]